MAGRVFVSENSRTVLMVSPSAGQPSKFPQYLAAILATLGAMCGGSFMAWTSPALPLLTAPGGVPQLSAEQGSWAGALFNLGGCLGALPAGLLADRAGRRGALCLLSLPLLGAWLLIALAPSVPQLLAGRLLGGAAVGAVSVAVPAYIAELAQSSIRGALGTLFQLQITAGILFGYLAGSVGDARALGLICCALPLLFLASFFWMPESPSFLLSKDRTEDARKALQWFRGKNCYVEDELSKMADGVREAALNKGGLSDLLSPCARRALVVALGLMAFQQLSGVTAVIFYSGQIFQAAGSDLSPTAASVVIGVVQVVATYVSSLLIDRAGRRALLLTSSSVMGACLACLGLYFHLQDQAYDLSGLAWLPLASLALYIVVFSAGFGPVPWVMFGELFPSNVKGVASAVTASCNWLLAFAVTKVFPGMLAGLGSPITFWVFSAFCALGTVFTACLVPETKGKDLQEVQLALSGRKSGQELSVVTSDSRKTSFSLSKPV